MLVVHASTLNKTYLFIYLFIYLLQCNIGLISMVASLDEDNSVIFQYLSA
jgi:hypothetical protein